MELSLLLEKPTVRADEVKVEIFDCSGLTVESWLVQVALVVAERSGVPLDRLRLIYRARVLEEDKKISDYITEDDHIVHLMAKTLRTGSA